MEREFYLLKSNLRELACDCSELEVEFGERVQAGWVKDGGVLSRKRSTRALILHCVRTSERWTLKAQREYNARCDVFIAVPTKDKSSTVDARAHTRAMVVERERAAELTGRVARARSSATKAMEAIHRSQRTRQEALRAAGLPDDDALRVELERGEGVLREQLALAEGRGAASEEAASWATPLSSAVVLDRFRTTRDLAWQAMARLPGHVRAMEAGCFWAHVLAAHQAAHSWLGRVIDRSTSGPYSARRDVRALAAFLQRHRRAWIDGARSRLQSPVRSAIAHELQAAGFDIVELVVDGAMATPQAVGFELPCATEVEEGDLPLPRGHPAQTHGAAAVAPGPEQVMLLPPVCTWSDSPTSGGTKKAVTQRAQALPLVI